jgi:hypothetical protein
MGGILQFYAMLTINPSTLPKLSRILFHRRSMWADDDSSTRAMDLGRFDTIL